MAAVGDVQVDFRLSEDQLLLRNTVRRFVGEQVAPHARDWSRDAAFPRAVVAGLGELGLLGIEVEPEWDGAGLGAVDSAVVIEELARGDGGLALTVGSHNGLCAGHLRAFGTSDQKRRWLSPLARGEMLGAWALAEPLAEFQVSSDAASLRTRAVRDGDHWVLDGEKILVTQGTVAGAIVVLARTDPDARALGITAFVVPGDAPGLERRCTPDKLGVRSSDTGHLRLHAVRVPDADRLGELGRGFENALQVLDRARIHVGALCVGLGEGALDAARRYAQERTQFGQPIASFQAIQWKLADMATELDASRLLVHRAAWACDAGEPFARAASMAKLYASETAVRVADHAIQIHGGYGYTTELPVERAYRDAALFTIGEGTSEVQRALIARDLLAEARAARI